jgi:tripartite-type tricarboxylate transporter receptor subunit TctC
VKDYGDLFKRLSESQMRKEKYIKENMLTPDYNNSAETRKLGEAEDERYAKILKEMGIIK